MKLTYNKSNKNIKRHFMKYKNYTLPQIRQDEIFQENNQILNNRIANQIEPNWRETYKTLKTQAEKIEFDEKLAKRIGIVKEKNQEIIEKELNLMAYEDIDKEEERYREQQAILKEKRAEQKQIRKTEALKHFIEDHQEYLEDLEILKKDAKLLEPNKPIIELEPLKTEEKTKEPHEIGVYADLTNYPAENNQVSIEFNSYKPSRFYQLKKEYQQNNIFYQEDETYSILKTEHHEAEKAKKAIIRKTDLTLFEIVIKFDKEHFEKVKKANAVIYNYYSKKPKFYINKLASEFISQINKDFNLKALEYSLKEKEDFYELNILFYNYDFKGKHSIVKNLLSKDYKAIKAHLELFNQLGFSLTKTKKRKQRITKKLSSLFNKLDAMLEEGNKNHNIKNYSNKPLLRRK